MPWNPGPEATNGNDVFTGGPTNDFVSGLDGDDVLNGLEGIDSLNGDGGNDTLDGGASDDFIAGGFGADVLDGGAGNDSLIDGPYVLAPNENDTLRGGDGDDLIRSLGGADVINGGTGIDTLEIDRAGVNLSLNLEMSAQLLAPVVLADGTSIVWMDRLRFTSGDGNDIITGGTLDDILQGAGGDDTLAGGGSGDLLAGGAGNDALDGGDGDDELDGGAGDDDLIGGAGNDILRLGGTGEAHGGHGNDTLAAGTSATSVRQFGEAGNDWINDTPGNDTLDGGDGDDSVTHLSGVDILTGGAGIDAANLFLWLSTEDLTIDLNDATTGTLTLEDGTTVTGFERLIVTTGSGADTVTGGAFNDIIRSGDNNDTIDGGGGDDELQTDGGNDFVQGGDGNDLILEFDNFEQSALDTLLGGDGNDIIFAQLNAGDVADGGDDIDTAKLSFINFASAIAYTQGESDLQGVSILNFEILDFIGTTFNDVITGGALDDQLSGIAGDDTLNGGGGNDYLYGSDGNDILNGGTGSDEISTGAGSDLVNAGDGDDRVTIDTTAEVHGDGGADTLTVANNAIGASLFGESDNDTIVARFFTPDDLDASFSFNGGDGVDTLDVSLRANLPVYVLDLSAADEGTIILPGGATATDFERFRVTMFGMSNDTLTGGAFADVIESGDGQDVVYGGGGNDVLRLGAGIDTAHGGDGDDVIADGVDFTSRVTIYGEAGDDFISGQGTANSTFDGGAGVDRLQVGFTSVSSGGINFALGNQTIATVTIANFESIDVAGTSFNDTIAGGVLDDSIYGAGGNDSLTGGAGNDIIGGGEGADTLNGGDGDDVLDSDEGVDTMTGGNGNDHYEVDDLGDAVVESTGQGIDSVFSYVTFILPSHVENLTLAGSSLTGLGGINGTGNDLDNVIVGNVDVNTLNGGVGNDTLRGGERDDTLLGQAGNDYLDGESGDDQMQGGDGDDIYVVDTIWDSVVEASAVGGIDAVRSSVTFTLGVNFEHLTLIGDAAIGGTGNALANTIVGNIGSNALHGGDGNDALDGAAGADALNGGAGNDDYVVDDIGDVVTEAAGNGTDTVQSSIDYTLAVNVERLTLTGAAHINATGNAHSNILTGNSGNNALNGRGGADQLNGGAGEDTVDYSTSLGGVRVNLASGVGLDNEAQGDTYLSIENAVGSAFDDRFTGSSAANQFFGGAGVDTMLGQSGNDVLNGEAGNDVLRGDAGNDTLSGGDNDDLLTGGAGADQLNGGAGVDTADYSASLGPIRVNLASLQGLDNDAQGDRYNSIEIVIGSNFADRFTGSANGDTFRAGAGADVLLGQNGDDVLDGGSGADNLNGGNNNDVLIGGAGADVLAGGTGIDIIDYSASSGGVRANISANLGLDNDAQGDTFNSVEGVIGSAFNDRFTGATQFGDNFRGGDGDDTLLGQAGNDLLFGEAGNDTLTGGGNDDILNGGLGADSMNGGAGLDAFVFADVLGAGNVDTIVGFNIADDVIHLSTAIFGVGAGALSASAFVIAAAAQDADDRVIYNSTTGALYYDADGNGAGAAVQFAALTAGLALTNADFFGFDP